MVNIDSKRIYSESIKEVEEIINIDDSYKNITRIWCGWLLKNDLGISLYSFKKYYSYLMDNHYSASTINMNIVMMKSRILFLFDLVNNEIDKRATLDYKLKLLKAPSLPVKAVSNEKIFSKREINKLIGLSGKKTSLIIEFLYITACRRAEMCNILLKDCKNKKNYVEISLYGKRNKIRLVVIPKELYKRITNVFMGDKYLFENYKNEKYTGHSVWELVSTSSNTHINKHMSPHMIRHTRLTHLYEDTGDMKAVSLFAGHTSIKTSLDYYVHHGFDKKTLLGNIRDF